MWSSDFGPRMPSVSLVVLCLGILFLEVPHDEAMLTMWCDMRSCAKDLYLNCPYGLQRDNAGCDICACRPSPPRLCTRMLCGLLCSMTPSHLYMCPSCFCQQFAHQEPKKTIYFGASPEHVDAAMTGQIRVKTGHVMQRLEGMCFATSARWRTMDGSCNNGRNYGATFMPVARVLSPVYDDGRQSPRTRSVRGGQLPSARLVSRRLHTDMDRSSDRFTAMLMQFGQFIDHDITAFPLITGTKRTIRCCNRSGHRKRPLPHRDCFPIDVTGDSVFSPSTCMEFVRSVPAMDKDGYLISPRQNVNSVTAFVDASVIYGSSEEHVRELRDNNGTGKFLRTSHRNFLPLDDKDSCVRRQTSDPCFLAGDERANEQPALTALHTVFLREHNRIAFSLSTLLPQASDEEIFQRTRAILGAMLQNILYGQWLPLVLGPVYMHRYGLNPGHPTLYNPDIDPRITNVFSTAAFRFGHSMIPHALSMGDRAPLLRTLFNKPFEVYSNMYDLVHGLINGTGRHRQRAQTVDRHFAREVTDHLFQPSGNPRKALDLVALNIQRGRDHGLPSYWRYRRWCGLPDVYTFTDPCLGTAGPHLQQIYSDVNDIDMFTGSMAEVATEQAIVGPTIACILARQFHALKYGDRFYFEAVRGPNGFSERQVAELRKASLGWILCNILQLDSVNKDVFQVAGPSNPVLTCDEVKASGPDLRILSL